MFHPLYLKKLKRVNYLFAHFDIFTKLQDLELQLALSGLFSISQFKNKTIHLTDSTGGGFSFVEESAKSTPIISSEESMRSIPESTMMIAESDSQDSLQYGLDVTKNIVDSEITVNSDLFLPFLIITVILGGITVYYLWKSRKVN